MKNISLTLKGFRGIRDGMGRDSIELNFEELVGDAQLVALKGPNGRGKTTILDNMHPFPVMPSRAGADGLGAFSYYDQVYLPESLKDHVWEHDGRRYRTQMVFRVNGKKKTEAYLHELREGKWQPVRLEDGTVSDGKVDTYKRCVEGILGSQETFFTSAFSAQGKRQLTAFKNGEIKSLMADLLGHEAIRATGAQGSEVAKLVKVGLSGIRQELAALQAEEGQAVVKRAALGDPAARIDTSKKARAQAVEALDAAKGTLAKVRADMEVAAQTDARRAQLTTEQTSMIGDGRAVLAQLDQQLEREGARLTDLERRMARRIHDAKTRRQTLEGQLAKLRNAVATRPAIERAKCRRALAEAVVVGREAQLARRRAAVERVDALVTNEKTATTSLATIEREAGQAALRANDLAKRFGLAGEVPCTGTALQGKCKLLGDAMEAKTLMPSADLEIARLQERKTGELQHLADIRAALADALADLAVDTPAAARASLGRVQFSINKARERSSRFTVLAARHGEVEQAVATLAGVEAELNSLDAQGYAESDEDRAERTAITEVRAGIETQRKTLATQYRTRYDQVTKLLADLPAPADATIIQRAEKGVEAAQTASAASETAFLGAVRDQETAAGLDQRIAEIRTQVATIQGRNGLVEQQLATWTLFAKCMSNDGVIALLIDDAGPTLAALANDLLLACHGPRFTVSIQTQTQTDKGDMREGFDIMVFDADSGTSKSVCDMSGGQRVWINECMVRAIALYLAQNSGRKYETLFCDEADGPLDPEHKRMFMAMKREVLRIGGYSQEFFVSQTPELTAMADAVIDLDQFVEADAVAGVEGTR
jgi:DNA repair protein SbcC/Rad50